MNLRRSAVIAALAGALGVSMSLGVAAPAQAMGVGGAFDLLQYMLTVKSSQLAASQSKNYPTAWSNQQARLTAAQAGGYNVRQVYGVQPLEEFAEIVPIKNSVDPNLGKRLTIGPGGRGIQIPVTQVKDFLKVTPAAVGGATIALTGFMYRADMSNGLLSWLGQDDVQGLVCGESGMGQGTFIEFVTGQDCTAWEMTQAAVEAANAEIKPGLVGEKICLGDDCVRLLSAVPWMVAPGWNAITYCWDTEGTVSGGIASVKVTLSNGRELPYQSQSGSVSNCASAGVLGADWSYSWDGSDIPPGAESPASYCFTAGSGPGAEARMCNAGSPVGAVTETSTDPDRYLECRIYASNGQTYIGETAPFRASDGQLPPPSCAALPAGVHPTRIVVTELGPGISNVLQDESVTEEFLDYQRDYAAECAERTCLLDLIQNSTGLSCFGLGEACADWMTSPTRDADYSCKYAGRPEPAKECFAYANVFNSQKRLAGNAYSDPATGRDMGGSTSLRYDLELMGAPARGPGTMRDCGGAGWGDPNPLQWVLKPIQCALEWAFVPRAVYVEAQGMKLSMALDTRAPGQLANMIGGWHINPSPMTGCSRSVPWSPADALNGTSGSTTLWNVCPGSPAEPLGIMSRAVVGVGFAVLVFQVLKRSVGKTVDYS